MNKVKGIRVSDQTSLQEMRVKRKYQVLSDMELISSCDLVRGLT